MVYLNKRMWTVGVSLFCIGNMAVSTYAQPETSEKVVQEEEALSSVKQEEEESPSDSILQREGEAVSQASCASPEEFRQQLLENDGKTVTLTGDIIWNKQEDEWLVAEEATTIDMNGYSLVIEDNTSIMLQGPIHFIGKESKNKPIIVLGENSSFTGYAGVTVLAEGVNCIAAKMQKFSDLIIDSIQASGEESIAVLVEGETQETISLNVKGDIIASGNGATALQGTGNLYLHYNTISVTGENSAAVRTDGNVFALFTEIDGQDVIVDTPGEVVFDSCEINPIQENAVTITRKAIPEAIHITALAGENYSLPDYISFRFELVETEYNGVFSSEIAQSYNNSHQVEWDTSQVDSQRAGIYSLTAIPLEYQHFSTIDFDTITGKVQIIDGIPEIVNAFYMFDNLVLKLDTQISEEIPFVVSYKMEDSDQWEIYEDASLDESKNTITLSGFGNIAGEREREITFRIAFTLQSEEKVTDDFSFRGEKPDHDGGGDRDGGDQSDQGSNKVFLQTESKENEAAKKDFEDVVNFLKDFIQPMGEALQQIGKEFPAPVPEATAPLLEKTEAEETEVRAFPETVEAENDNSEETTKEITEKAEDNPIDIPLVPNRGYEEQKKQSNKPEAVTAFYNTEKNSNKSDKKEQMLSQPENTIAVLTGKELSYLVQANPNYLTFPAEEIRLLLPTEVLKELSLSPEEQLRIELTQNGQVFLVRILVNEKELTDWTANPIQVYLSKPAEMGEAIYCYQKKENPIPAKVMENGEILFQLQTTGEYTLAADENAHDEKTSKEQIQLTKEKKRNVIYLVPVVLLVLGFAILISTRRKG